MLILNRLRGMFSWFAWVIGILLGLAVFIIFDNPYVALLVMAGYIAGESMGWGEWFGGLINGATNIPKKRNGQGNGIEFLATRLFDIDTVGYHITALFIRGFYWWILALLPLAWHVGLGSVLLAVIALAIAFPMSVIIAKECTFTFSYVETPWHRSEVIYGGVINIVLPLLILSAFN